MDDTVKPAPAAKDKEVDTVKPAPAAKRKVTFTPIVVAKSKFSHADKGDKKKGVPNGEAFHFEKGEEVKGLSEAAMKHLDAQGLLEEKLV